MSDPAFEYFPTDLVAFIDETGHPSLADLRHPVFGLGGCAMPAPEYFFRIAPTWTQLREAHFPDVVGPLHAAAVTPTGPGIEALAKFFLESDFRRLAALATLDSDETTRNDVYDRCSATLMAFLHQAAVSLGCQRIVLTFESLGAGDDVPSRYLSQQARFADSSHDHVPSVVFRARKTECLPGLEIADFVMHAAGGQVRRGRDFAREQRRDYQAVFTGVRDELVHFGVLNLPASSSPPPYPVL